MMHHIQVVDDVGTQMDSDILSAVAEQVATS